MFFKKKKFEIISSDIYQKIVSFSRNKILKDCGFNFVQVKPSCDEEAIKKQIKKR